MNNVANIILFPNVTFTKNVFRMHVIIFTLIQLDDPKSNILIYMHI